MKANNRSASPSLPSLEHDSSLPCSQEHTSALNPASNLLEGTENPEQSVRENLTCLVCYEEEMHK
jgi:hypothetical protein